MSQQGFVFPELVSASGQRPARCPRCGQVGMGWHRRRVRTVLDLRVPQVGMIQYQCEGCGASLTVPPPGLEAGRRHSNRTKAISVVLWGLGLSYENVSRMMKGLGLPISDVGVLLNVRAMGTQAMAWRRKPAAKIKTPVLGAEETQVKLSANGVTVGFLCNPGTGEIVGMRILASREGEELAQWIVEAAKHFGAKALASDELRSYHAIGRLAEASEAPAEAAAREHQLRFARWRRAVEQRLRRIEGYPQEKEVIREALTQLDEPARTTTRRLHRQFAQAPAPRKGEKQSPAYALRMLTLDVLETWKRLSCY